MNKTAFIHKLNHEGRGIAYHEGKVQFIHNALPGETVHFSCTHQHKRFDEGIAGVIENPSKDRVTPPCPYFMQCGGCRVQHMSPTTQVMFKQEQCQEQLKHFGACEPHEWLPPLHLTSLGYRHKARLCFDAKQASLGFYAMDGVSVFPIHQCLVLHPKLTALLPGLTNVLRHWPSAPKILHVELALGDEEGPRAVTVVSRQRLKQDTIALKNWAQENHTDCYLYAEDSDRLVKIYPLDTEERLHYTLPRYRLKMAFHPQDFTQINLEMNRKMIDRAIEWLALTEKDHVLDLFCGIGNFTLPMARWAASVTGIEGSHPMVERAQENARVNHIQNVHFHQENLNKKNVLASYTHFNKVLIDPPRTGALNLLPSLMAPKPESILYISCNSATLARDAKILGRGYTLDKIGLLDMFPHTEHSEVMALFRLKN